MEGENGDNTIQEEYRKAARRQDEEGQNLLKLKL